MMMTEAQAPRQHALPQVLSGIISAARRRAGVAALSDAALADEYATGSASWRRYHRTGSKSASCTQFATAWSRRFFNRRNSSHPGIIREADRANKPEPMAVAGGESCWYCEGTGWQTLARKVPDSYGENTFVRPCACSAAPLEIRKLEPLGEPEWRKRKHSVIWERTE